VIIERDWNNVTRARYTRGLGYGGGIGGIISEERRTGQGNNTVSRYYHYDGIGTVTGLSNKLGYLTQSFSYDAFGNMLGARDEFRDAATGGYRFSTKESNTKSGLVYFGARYYDPRIGRFITPDPLTWGPDDERTIRINGIPGDFIVQQVIYLIGSSNPVLSHRYCYVFNNPANLVDPFGLSPFNSSIWTTIGESILNYYGSGDLALRGIIAIGAFPLFKPWLGLPVAFGASKFTNIISYLGFIFFQNARITVNTFGTVRVFGVLGRINIYIGIGLLVYDIVSITIRVIRENN
ncbi:MAG: RHS repeat-associated core domain-containing protein, partial [Deltaproteobacteria bacterium]